MTFPWRRARRMFPSFRRRWLEEAYSQPEAQRNFGYAVEGPKRGDARTLAEVAPHIMAQTERVDTVLWPALFKMWPEWHWGMQPTGDCTRWMKQHELDVTMAVQSASGKIRKPDALVAGESLYGFGKCELHNSYRYHGAGARGEDMAGAAMKYGSLYRKLYTDGKNTCDLRKETDLSILWGDKGKGVPDWLEPYAAEHKAKDKVPIRNSLEAGLGIQAGYAGDYCGYTRWATVRGSDGIATRMAAGWHAITAVGVRWDKNGDVLALWIANTGHGDHVEGPVGPIDVPAVYAECGGWVPAREYDRVSADADCYLTTFIDGWPIAKRNWIVV